jgi:hypothetical protein
MFPEHITYTFQTNRIITPICIGSRATSRTKCNWKRFRMSTTQEKASWVSEKTGGFLSLPAHDGKGASSSRMEILLSTLASILGSSMSSSSSAPCSVTGTSVLTWCKEDWVPLNRSFSAVSTSLSWPNFPPPPYEE